MATQTTQENLDALIKAIHALIEVYKKSEVLIVDQISCVVKSDVDKLVEFADQQTRLNQELEEQEIRFREELETLFVKVAPNASVRKLSHLIPHLDTDKAALSQLRKELIIQITNTKNKQAQLISLIEFAQKHTTDTLRAIHSMSNNSSKHYTMAGKAATQQRSIAINQTA